MAQVNIAMAGIQDAFAVAALHLQHDRAGGAAGEPGFLDRFADAWLPQQPIRPTWLATSSAGDPVGVLGGVLISDLPALGRPEQVWLHLGLLYVVPAYRRDGLAARLLSQAQRWCTRQGASGVQVRAHGATSALYADHGFGPADTDVLQWRPIR